MINEFDGQWILKGKAIKLLGVTEPELITLVSQERLTGFNHKKKGKESGTFVQSARSAQSVRGSESGTSLYC